MAAASTSNNPSHIVEVRDEYPYPSHVIAPNFVTVKLCNKSKYNVWETQMLCLLSSHGMHGFIDGTFVSPDDDDQNNGKGKVVGEMKKAWMRSNSLVKGWILGSHSEEAAIKVVNRLTSSNHKESDFTAKDAWDELQRTYGPSLFLLHKAVAADKEEMTSEANSINEDAKSEVDLRERVEKEEFNQIILCGDMDNVRVCLESGLKPTDKITKNGNTALHVAVGSSTKNHEMLQVMLEFIPAAENNSVFDLVNSDGSTVLHVAAIVGNTKAADILLIIKPYRFVISQRQRRSHTTSRIPF